MYVNIEFLDVEPIENVITCMHHKMDKVVFFGYKETIEECKKRTEDFMKKYCGVSEVEFCLIDKLDLDDVVFKIEEKVEAEEAVGNRVYFDITGGESLCLVAFGMLAFKWKKPMHMYDVKEDKLVHLGEKCGDNIENVPKNEVKLDLSTYIQMSGAKINDCRMGVIDINDEKFMGKQDELWQIVLDYQHQWNTFCNLLRDSLAEEKSLEATKLISKKQGLNLSVFHTFMIKLKKLGVFSKYESRIVSRNEDGSIAEVEVSVTYASFAWKECITKAGTALELHVYQELKAAGKEVNQSVRIDWDGKIHEGEENNSENKDDDTTKDVLNEIDVLTLEGNVPTFISCKAGKMDKGKALTPLYELETVATRFGGKYTKKVLATLYPVKGVYAERAEEMEIELRCYSVEGR